MELNKAGSIYYFSENIAKVAKPAPPPPDTKT